MNLRKLLHGEDGAGNRYVNAKQYNDLMEKDIMPDLDISMRRYAGEKFYYCLDAKHRVSSTEVTGAVFNGPVFTMGDSDFGYGYSRNAKPVVSQVERDYAGQLVITSKRFVFLSEEAPFDLSHDEVNHITYHTNGLVFQVYDNVYKVVCATHEMDAVEKVVEFAYVRSNPRNEHYFDGLFSEDAFAPHYEDISSDSDTGGKLEYADAYGTGAKAEAARKKMVADFVDLRFRIQGDYDKVADIISQLKRNIDYIRAGKADAEDMATMRGQLEEITQAYEFWRDILVEARDQMEINMKLLPDGFSEKQRKQLNDVSNYIAEESRRWIPDLEDTYHAYVKLLEK